MSSRWGNGGEGVDTARGACHCLKLAILVCKPTPSRKLYNIVTLNKGLAMPPTTLGNLSYQIIPALMSHTIWKTYHSSWCQQPWASWEEWTANWTMAPHPMWAWIHIPPHLKATTYTQRQVCHITSNMCSLHANLVIQLQNKCVQYEAEKDWAHTNASPPRTLWGGANRGAGLCLGSSSPTEISEPAKLSTTLYLQRRTRCDSREKLNTSSGRRWDRTGINLKFMK